jgi:phosphoribosylglycinamide formyltransferase-1
MARARTAILISGRGSNMAALLDAARDPAYPADIALVLSNRADAAGLTRAAAAGVPTAVVESRGFRGDRPGFEAAVQAVLAAHQVELVALAGFLRVLTPGFVARWDGRMVNIHPSLLPKFGGAGMYGDRVHQAVLDAGQTRSGCSVHMVDEEFDHGAIVLQRTCPVLPGDDVPTLAARVFEQEKIAYPEAIGRVLETLGWART